VLGLKERCGQSERVGVAAAAGLLGMVSNAAVQLGSAQRSADQITRAQLSVTSQTSIYCGCAGGAEANLAADEAAGRCVRPKGKRYCRQIRFLLHGRIRWLGGNSRH
jgi:hypothetical protein